MSNLISLSVDGVESKDLEKYLLEDELSLEDNFNIYIERERGNGLTDPTVIAAWIGGGTLALNTLMTCVTNIYINHSSIKKVSPTDKNQVVLVIQGDKNSTKFNLSETETLSGEKLESELDKIGIIRRISVDVTKN